jgi:hypothetical protein
VYRKAIDLLGNEREPQFAQHVALPSHRVVPLYMLARRSAQQEGTAITMNHSLPFLALTKDDTDNGPDAKDGTGMLASSHTFPVKLMEVLATEELNHIAQWTRTGRAFRIVDPDRFENEVLVLYFKRAKFSSFLRKLRRWGFTRIYRGPDSGKCFLTFLKIISSKETCLNTTLFTLQAHSFTRAFAETTLMRFLTWPV